MMEISSEKITIGELAKTGGGRATGYVKCEKK
jgi:hypothetical protein